MLKLETTIDAKQLAGLIYDLCEVPETFQYNTVSTQLKINIKTESTEERMHLKAALQECLRERFSFQERKKKNQCILKLLDKG